MVNFDGTSKAYTDWAARVKDHCQAVNFGWLRLLALIEAEQRQLTWDVLSTSTIDVLSSNQLLELSVMLWSFLRHVMTKYSPTM